MKSIKRLFQKDRFGFVRGTIALGFIFLLIAMLFPWILVNRDSRGAEERAADAARQVAQQFQILIEDGFRQMNVVSEEISQASEDALDQIANMVRYGVFNDAMIVSDGVEYRMDGTVAEVEQAPHYIRYHTDEVEGKIIRCEDDTVQLRVSIGESAELAACLDPDRLDWIMESAYAEDYGYAIYNSTTGAYLINRSSYEGGGYYDALLKLNSDGSMEKLLNAQMAETHVHSSRDGGSEYIAQTNTAIYPLSIALFIPGELLMQNEKSIGLTTVLFIVAILVLILALAVYVVVIMRSMRQENSLQRRRSRISEKMLVLAAEDSKSRLYLYQRRQDKVLAYYDGLRYEGESEETAAPRNISELGVRCGLSESDIEQLQERVRELKPGERCNLNLLCSVQDSKHLLRFTLNSDEENGDLVLGAMRDCTMEQQMKIRFSDERNYRKAILPKTTTVWQINFGRDRWKLTDCRPGVEVGRAGIKLNEWRDYEGDLNGLAREYVHPEDYADYTAKMNAEAILDAYTRGKFEQVMECRLLGFDGQYQWHRQVLRVFKHPDSGEIIANLYLLNVDAEKNAEIERTQRSRILQQTLTALGGIYYGLYYVNLDDDLCYAARTHGGEMITQLSTPFKETFAKYIQRNVVPEDREKLSKLLDPYYIRKNIREGCHFVRCEYRRIVGDGYEWSAVIVQAARFENATVREVVVALRDINGEKQNDAQ